MKKFVLHTLLAGLFLTSLHAQKYAHRISLHIETTIDAQAPSITLHVSRFANSADDFAIIRRKELGADAWTELSSNHPVSYDASGQFHYTDTTVQLGVAYEYQVFTRRTDPSQWNDWHDTFDASFGYVATGIDVPALHERGGIILVVDDTLAAGLAADLEAYAQTLVGAGWTVQHITAPRHQDYPNTTATPALKNQIASIYDSDPAHYKGVILIGRVQIPYSGDNNPDGHGRRAWPADAYYGDMTGTWTDDTVNRSTFNDSRNHNVPGDGKFDQRFVENMELFVGRIDFSNLPALHNQGLTEEEMIRRYLRKNFRHRTGVIELENSGLLADGFKFYTAGYSGWTGFRGVGSLFDRAALFEPISGATLRKTVLENEYRMAYVSSAGNYNGLGRNSLDSDLFAYGEVPIQFLFPFGSYFGDWDSPANNFLKMSLAGEKYGLVSMWGNAPETLVHPMAMDRPIGESLLISMDRARNFDTDYYGNNHSFTLPVATPLYRFQEGMGNEVGSVQHAILGDPTLTLYNIPPARNLQVARGSGNTLTWQTAPGNPLGYHVYRAATAAGPFTRLTASAVQNTTFFDADGGGTDVYMVRTEAAFSSSKGSFRILSQGIFSNGSHMNQAPFVQAVETPLLYDLSAALSATAWDDQLAPEQLTTTWMQLDGPAAATITNGNTLTPTITTATPGYYLFSVHVSDGELTHTDTVGVRLLGDRFTATDATYINQNASGTAHSNFQSSLRVDQPNFATFLRFDLGDPGPVSLTHAVLRLRAQSSNFNTGTITVASVQDTAWQASTLTWNHAPPAGEVVTSVSFQANQSGTWVEIDLSDHLAGRTGPVAMRLTSDVRMDFVSDDFQAGSFAPNLEVTYQPSPGQLSFEAAEFTVYESAGAVATQTVHRIGGQDGEVRISYATVDGTAVAGTDYLHTSGTLVWADGDMESQTIDIPIVVNETVDPARSFTVELSDPHRADLGGIPSATVHRLDPTEGLILHYRFDEGSGTQITDSSPLGADHTTTVAGAAWSSVGRFGGAYGSNTTTALTGFFPANETDLRFNPGDQEYTVSAWVRTETNNGFRPLWHRGNQGSVQTVGNNGIYRNLQAFSGNSNGVYQAANDEFLIYNGEWHLLTFVNFLDGATWRTRLYLNNGQQIIQFNTGATFDNTIAKSIGMRNDGVNPWTGLIDDFRVYTRALTPQEVSLLYAGAYGGFPVPTPPRTAATYYLDAENGDDANNGLSAGQAWQSLGNIAEFGLIPGDTVLLAAGQTFSGNLVLDDTNSGTAEEPITLGTFGEGRATLDAGDGHGIFLYNAGGFVIRDLVIVGNGIGSNQGHGIFLYTDLPGRRPAVRVENVDVSGFANQPGQRNGGIGMFVLSWREDNQVSGFEEVTVLDSVFHHNEIEGFSTWAHQMQGHRNLVIRGCTFHSNPGQMDYGDPSGSGLVIGRVDTALVEYSLAYNNGGSNGGIGSENGGVGIWTYDSNNVIIQHSISHSNRTLGADGGGFDLDGGVTDSILQYNYTYGNDGAGYLLAQYAGAPAFGNNIVRYNISQNDGRRGNYGGIMLWAAQAGNRVRDVEIYNNTVFVTPSATYPSTTPSAFRMLGGNFTNINVRNNLFIADGNTHVRVINADVANSTAEVLFQGNAYHHRNRASANIRWGGTSYNGLAAWRAAAGQETLGGQPVGLEVDPFLASNDPAPMLTDPAALSHISAYRLTLASPLRDAALPLGSSIGNRDFFGGIVPVGTAADIGAHEFPFANAYAEWAAGIAWEEESDSHPGADPNQSGLSNLWSYHLARNPLSPAPEPVYSVMMSEGSFWHLEFRRRKNNPTLIYEISTDLTDPGAWTPVTPVETLLDADPLGNGSAEDVRQVLPIPPEGILFHRIRLLTP